MQMQPSDPMGTAHRVSLLTLALVCAAAYATLLLVSGPAQITDPFIHYDDYPVFLSQPEGYYSKTLEEGRWVNFLWASRGMVTPAWLNYQFYLAGWAVFAGAASLAVLRGAPLYYCCLLAAALCLAPQTVLISGWFNTTTPGVLLLALFALITLNRSADTANWLLLLFVPLIIQAYSSFPFVLLALCLLRNDQPHTFFNFLKTITIFAGALLLGMLIIYTLNWTIHGVFGLPLADWRSPTPASNLTELIANVPHAVDGFVWTLAVTGFGKPALAAIFLAAFAVSLVFIAQRAPLEAAYFFVAATAGLAFLSLHSLLQGIQYPARSTYFLWFALCSALARASWYHSQTTRKRPQAPSVLFAAFVVASFLPAFNHIQNLSGWQSKTKSIAQAIPTDADQILIHGTHLALDDTGAVGTLMSRDVQFRINRLTGKPTLMCSDELDGCDVPIPHAIADAPEDFGIYASDRDVHINLPISEFPR